jgi:hypothetical protein
MPEVTINIFVACSSAGVMFCEGNQSESLMRTLFALFSCPFLSVSKTQQKTNNTLLIVLAQIVLAWSLLASCHTRHVGSGKSPSQLSSDY